HFNLSLDRARTPEPTRPEVLGALLDLQEEVISRRRVGSRKVRRLLWGELNRRGRLRFAGCDRGGPLPVQVDVADLDSQTLRIDFREIAQGRHRQMLVRKTSHGDYITRIAGCPGLFDLEFPNCVDYPTVPISQRSSIVEPAGLQQLPYK